MDYDTAKKEMLTGTRWRIPMQGRDEDCMVVMREIAEGTWLDMLSVHIVVETEEPYLSKVVFKQYAPDIDIFALPPSSLFGSDFYDLWRSPENNRWYQCQTDDNKRFLTCDAFEELLDKSGASYLFRDVVVASHLTGAEQLISKKNGIVVERSSFDAHDLSLLLLAGDSVPLLCRCVHS